METDQNIGRATRLNLTPFWCNGEQLCIFLGLKADVQNNGTSITQWQNNIGILSWVCGELQTLQCNINISGMQSKHDTSNNGFE